VKTRVRLPASRAKHMKGGARTASRVRVFSAVMEVLPTNAFSKEAHEWLEEMVAVPSVYRWVRGGR